MKEIPDILTTLEVAAHFGVTPSAVTNWAQKGMLQAVLASGRMYLFKRETVMSFVPPYINGCGRRPGSLVKKKKPRR